MYQGRSAFKILTAKCTERDLWGGLGVDGLTILEWILKKWVLIRGIRVI